MYPAEAYVAIGFVVAYTVAYAYNSCTSIAIPDEGASSTGLGGTLRYWAWHVGHVREPGGDQRAGK